MFSFVQSWVFPLAKCQQNVTVANILLIFCTKCIKSKQKVRFCDTEIRMHHAKYKYWWIIKQFVCYFLAFRYHLFQLTQNYFFLGYFDIPWKITQSIYVIEHVVGVSFQLTLVHLRCQFLASSLLDIWLVKFGANDCDSLICNLKAVLYLNFLHFLI